MYSLPLLYSGKMCRNIERGVFRASLNGTHFFIGGLMFISLSKTIARFGGFRLGIGMRLNKKNAIWLSLIIMFVAMFQLMWYMLLLCGWMIYAVCYGIYWCIKKIIVASSKKQNNKQTPNTMSKATQNPQTERKEDTPTMTPEMNNSSNKKPNNQSPKKKSAIVRWIVGGFFAMFALVNGFHFSSLFLLCAAFLMFPLPFMETFLQKKNIKVIVAIILSVALFFVGVLTSPPFEPTDPSDDTIQTTPSDNEDNNNSTKPDNSTTKPDNSTTKPDNSTTNNNTTTAPDNTTNDDEKVEMVWIASSGTKYHSKASCSNMNSPRQISLEDAKNQGYTACKNCH